MTEVEPHAHVLEYELYRNWWTCVRCGAVLGDEYMPDPRQIEVTYL